MIMALQVVLGEVLCGCECEPVVAYGDAVGTEPCGEFFVEHSSAVAVVCGDDLCVWVECLYLV